MKVCRFFVIAVMALMMAIVGCSKRGSVDTTALEKTFKEAEAASQSAAQKVVAAVKAEDFPGAVSQLEALAKNAKLTPEQQQAVKDVLAQVQKALSEAASKASTEANKAVGDVQKSLPK